MATIVGLFLPFEDHPEHDSGEERGHGVHLGLDSGEPESVGPAVSEGSDDTGSYQGDSLTHGESSVPAVFLYDAASQMDYGQVQEEYGECRAEGTHNVDRHGRMFRRCEHGEEPGYHLEHRVARGVSHFQFVG